MKSKKQVSSGSGSCLIICLKGLGILILISLLFGFGWIAGIVWLLFFRKKSTDTPRKKQIKTITICSLSVLSFIFMIYSFVFQPKLTSGEGPSYMAEQDFNQNDMNQNLPVYNAIDNNISADPIVPSAENNYIPDAPVTNITNTEPVSLPDMTEPAPVDNNSFDQFDEPEIDYTIIYDDDTENTYNNFDTYDNTNNNFDTYDNTEQQHTADSYVLNTSSHKIHYPSCSAVRKIAPNNYATSNKTVNELVAEGYSTCGICF